MSNRIVKVILRGDVADLQAKMVVASKAIKDTADKATGASKASQEYRKHLSTLGTTAGAVGLAAAAGLGLAVAAAARFDSSMSKVQAATHESAANMDLLRAAAIKAGADTVFSATEAADAVTALAKAGVGTKDILSGGLAGSLSLASAGELDVASAAEIAATAMTQFGLAGKDIPHIADLLAAAAGKAQGDVTDMAASLKYVGPVAHQMGISIEETTGTIAELASQGILGEQAGTSLRGMLTALTSPSKQAAKSMKDLGINLYDANGKFVGLRGIAGQLGTTMGKLTNAERDQALGRIFGNEQITAARILYAGGAEAVDKWTRAVNDNGYAADTAAIKMNNLKGDLEQLRGSMETALIGLGEGDQGALRGLVQHLTQAVNAFNDLPAPVKSATTALLGITAVTGGALWFGSKVLGGIAEARVALKGLGIEAATTRTALLGIGKGLEFAAILEGLSLVDAGLQHITHTTLDTSKLAGDIDTLGATGQATGTVLKTFGGDLHRFGIQARQATDFVPKLENAIAGWAPGSTSVETATKNFKAVDEALTALVKSGKGDEAARVFDTLAAAAEKEGVSVDKVTKFFPGYTSELVKNSGAANLVSDAMTGLIPAADGVTAATGPMALAVQQSTADLAAQAKALETSRKTANGTAHEFFGLGKSVNDSKVSLDDWIKDLDKQAAALRDFTKNAKTAGKKGLKEGLIAELEAAGPAGAMRLKQLADASEAEIKRANRAWARGQRAIDAYTNAVGGVAPVVLEVDGADAMVTALRRINHAIHEIPRRWQTEYYVTQVNALNKRAGGGRDGDPSTPYATGGQIQGPGTGTSDSITIRASAGEFMQRKAAVDYYGVDYMTALNNLNVPRFAAGGVVGGSGRSGAGASLIDYDRLTQALLSARPIFGPVHLSGDGAFEREQRARTAALGGVGRPGR